MSGNSNRSADVIVIGAGVVGASIAYQLAKSGRKVILVDKGAGAGFGSSSASSGVIRFEYTLATSVIVAWEAAHMWADLRDYLEAPASEALAVFHRNGKIMMDCPAFPRELLRAHFDALGIAYEEWDPAELRRRVGGIDPGRHFPPRPIDSDAFWEEPVEEIGAIYTPQAGFIDDPRLACENFANAARRAGAEALYRTRVMGAEALAGGEPVWRLTLDSGAAVEAPLVVNAAGPWSAEVNSLASVGGEFAITTRPLRQEVHAVPAPAGFNPPGRIGPCVADQDLGYYLHPEPSGSLQIGGTEPECDTLDWVDGPVDAVNLNRTAELFEKQVTRAARRFPGLAIPPRPAGVVGVYDVATDWTPIYDKTDAAGFYVAIGTSGNQFKNGPIIGEFMNGIVALAESGADHDVTPASYTGRITGRTIDLGFYSRLREPAANSGTVAG
ncbi:MAG: FAD-binding oxidoreductase [Bifidobacteriaceae bacterium]|jgi:glycine/D-amino acid oxidase-like deaminating enzyme|nr:FAD-binding oxidoreductase [Bifidobacteriaceae bacterium]